MRIGFHTRSREYTVLLAGMTAVLVLSILLFPERAFQSSLSGLTLWWTLVFPALLPFLMISELMGGTGVLRAIGILLSPLMKLFRLTGVGGWAVALGAVAGMPAGADAVARLRRERLIGRTAGERLLAMSHVASPYFILTIIGAGFWHSPEAGAVLALLHYTSALGAAALLSGFAGSDDDVFSPAAQDDKPSPASAAPRHRTLIGRALADMHRARLEDGRSFGKLLGDSVSGAIQTLMMIGGTIIVFSVALGVLDTLGASRLIDRAAVLLFPHLDSAAGPAHSGLGVLFEQHVGIYRISQLMPPSALSAALIGAALAWSGLAVHIQVKTAIRHTDLRYSRFLLSRIVHAALAFVSALLLWKPLIALFSRATPSFLHKSETIASDAVQIGTVWSALPHRLALLGACLLAMLLLAWLASAIGRKQQNPPA